LVGVAGLVTVVVSLVAFEFQTLAEQVHMDRSHMAMARVMTPIDVDHRQEFEIDRGPQPGAASTSRH